VTPLMNAYERHAPAWRGRRKRTTWRRGRDLSRRRPAVTTMRP